MQNCTHSNRKLTIGLSSPASNFFSHNKRFCLVTAWSEGNANTWPPECRFTTTRRGRGGVVPKYACKTPLPTGHLFLEKRATEHVNEYFFSYSKITRTTVCKTLTLNTAPYQEAIYGNKS